MTSTIQRCLVAIAWLVFPSTLLAQSNAISADQAEFFESRIRPVLVEQCYACHNSAENAEAGLSVDHRDALLAGGDGGRIVIPGSADASRLIAILKHEVDGLEMPEGGARLENTVIADFEKWIAMGAPDPRDDPPSATEIEQLTSWEATLQRRKQWWSFQKIQSVEPPPGEALHPIDRFIDAKLDDVGLQRSPPADASILIRRLFITLIGIPPTPSQVEHWSRQFRIDDQAAATDLIDQLMASPHFGERWARHWMDWIRYAESHGSEGDPRIDNAWRYRDYLIRALNEDVPYDQLVREHVAGDLLRSPRVNQTLGINESMIGTAHWRMVFHGFAPTDALDEKVRFVDDQINAFSKAFLGLTVSCARCHDHKFDAISQADYYALFGILGSCRPAREVIDLPERQNLHRQELIELKQKVRVALARDWHSHALDHLLGRLIGSDELEKDRSSDPLVKTLLEAKQATPESIRSKWMQIVNQHGRQEFSAPGASDWKLAREDDLNQWYRHGVGLDAVPSSAGEFAIASDGDSALLGIYPAGVYSHGLSTKHPARLTSPDALLPSNQKLWARVIGDGDAALRYVIQDYPRNGTVFPVRNLTPKWTWQSFDLSYWSGDSMHVELVTAQDAPLLVKGKGRSWFGVTDVMITDQDAAPPTHDEAMRALLQTDARPDSFEALAQVYFSAIQSALLAWENGTLSNDQAHLLDRCLRLGWLPNQIDQLPEAAPLLSQYRDLENQIPVPIRVPGLDETVGRTQPIFIRGNHKKPGELVPRRFLEAFDPTPYATQQSGRLALADDLLAEHNPLTRRVIVNRLWHHVFGRGIVETTDNLGRLGTKPTHPELLDWLATRLVADGWSLKQMIRLMVTSRTWQRSSAASDAANRLDPANQWLSHANVRRMEAEVIRDSLLAVSGRLELQPMFGPPVDGNANRRSVYVRVIRNALDPFLRAFDFPEPFSTVGRRDVTNVPAQSLTMMNAAQVGRMASDLATSVLQDADSKSDAERIDTMFVTLFARPPSDDERSLYLQHLQETKDVFAERANLRTALEKKLEQHRSRVQAIMEPIRQTLSEDPNRLNQSDLQPPEPISLWSFDQDLSDSVGSLVATAHGAAHLEDGALVVRSGGYVSTPPLSKPLGQKTLEAWVRLDNLQQRGGGVMTVQTKNGAIFDSIVFGEQSPGHWLAGSNNFRRTQSLGGFAESEAAERFVHVAIVYHKDGRIVAYRDGEPYGKAYKSNGPNLFPVNDTIVSFGVRHLPASGNRLLSGRIDQARLYDRALTDDEVAASFANAAGYVTREQVLAAMSESERKQVQTIEQQIQSLETELDAIGEIPGGRSELAAWTDLAHASLMMKEFIYVQ